MKISNDTWLKYRLKHGDYHARNMLKWKTRPDKANVVFRVRRKTDELARVMELVHDWPGSTPAENRLRSSYLIRVLIQRSREHRERILGYCSPGVSRQLLP